MRSMPIGTRMRWQRNRNTMFGGLGRCTRRGRLHSMWRWVLVGGAKRQLHRVPERHLFCGRVGLAAGLHHVAHVSGRTGPEDRRQRHGQPRLRGVRVGRTGHLVRHERRRCVRTADGVQARRVGVDEADGVVGPRLLHAPGGVPARSVHVCGADGHERPRVPRRAPVRHIDGVRDACAEPVVEPCVRGMPGGSCVRRQRNDDAVLGRVCCDTGRWLVHAVQRWFCGGCGLRAVHAVHRRKLRGSGSTLVHTMRIR